LTVLLQIPGSVSEMIEDSDLVMNTNLYISKTDVVSEFE